MSTHRDLMPPDLPSPGALDHSQVLPVAMRSVPAVAQDDIFFHLDLFRSLQLHRRLFGLILVVGLAAVAGYFCSAWPVYNAECLVYIRPAPPRLMAAPGMQTWPYDDVSLQSFIQQQLKNVTRSDVLRAALHKLPAGSWQRNGETEQEAVERLARAITVERMEGSYQVAITAKASDASKAATLANAVATSFVESARLDLRAGDPQRIQLLGEELERVKKALADDRAEQEQLNRSLGVANLGSKASEPFDAQIESVRLELGKARAAHDEAAARLTSLSATDVDSSPAMDAEADEIINSDPGLVSMKASLNQRRAQLISQMANLTPNHPQYKQNSEELSQINASLEKMMKELRGKAAAHIEQRLRNDLERTSAYEGRLNGQLAQMSGMAGTVTPRLQRASDLAIDIERLQNRYTVVDEQYRNLSIENQAPGAVYVSSPALPPLHASVMHLLRNIVIILFGALIAALGSAVVAHNLDPRVYIATDVERVLGFSPMAQLPDFHQVSDSVGEEYMLRLAAAIEHAYQQNGLKSCIITGVAPGAGTSTVASRVTTMLEGMGRSTVLVDASRTTAPQEPDAGTEAANQLVSMREDNSPSSLLQQMAEETGAETIVLTDTAPLLASGETEYLARFVDSAIVVIQSGLTTRAQLREVAQTLQRLEVAAVGFVLNRVSITKANPSFRQSVRAVEQRLAVQNRLSARHSPRTRPSAQHREAQNETQESSVVTEPEDMKQPDPLSPDASPPPAASEQTFVAAAAAPAAVHSVVEAESAPPRVARGRGEPRRPDIAARPPRSVAPPRPASHKAVPPAPKTAPDPARPEAAAQRRPVQPPAPEPHIPPSRLAAAPPVNAAPGRWTPPPPPAHPSVNTDPSPDDRASERDDAGYAAASRLGGLRNLLVSLGRKSLNNDGDVAAEPDLEPRFERATMRPAYPDSPLPVADAPDSDNPTRLTAQPEFLPPRPMVEVEKEKEVVRATPPRRDKPDPDEIQTLPSWRGQYRKKRYPPM